MVYIVDKLSRHFSGITGKSICKSFLVINRPSIIRSFLLTILFDLANNNCKFTTGYKDSSLLTNAKLFRSPTLSKIKPKFLFLVNFSGSLFTTSPEYRVSVQGVKSLGGHFACLCRGFEIYEVKTKILLFFKKKREILLHFLSFL